MSDQCSECKSKNNLVYITLVDDNGYSSRAEHIQLCEECYSSKKRVKSVGVFLKLLSGLYYAYEGYQFQSFNKVHSAKQLKEIFNKDFYEILDLSGF